MPEKYILTPADQIHFGDMIKERNAAVRLAIIKKFGFRRLMDTIRYRVISRADGNSLMEFTIHPTGKRSWVPRFRALQLTWQDKTGAKETFLPVPRLSSVRRRLSGGRQQLRTGETLDTGMVERSDGRC